MQIEVDITLADYHAFVSEMRGASQALMRGRKRWTQLLPMAAFGVVVGLLWTAFSRTSDTGMNWGSFGLGALSMLILLVLVQRDLWRNIAPLEDGSILGSHTFDFDEDGLRQCCEHCESVMRWAGVHELRETETHFFVMTDRIAGYVIPKRDLGGDEACEILRVLVTAQIEGARRPAANTDASAS